VADHSKNWQGIWLSFAGYALVIALIFPFVFKNKYSSTAKPDVIHV